MKKWIFAGLSIVVTLCIFAGCQESQQASGSKSVSHKGPLLLSVDFEADKPLTYNVVCQRDVAMDLDPSGKYSKGKKAGSVQKSFEKLQMELTYTPVGIDPYGYSTVEVSCSKADVQRSSKKGRSGSSKDAVESLVGKTYILKITPTGKIADYSAMKSVIKELGQKAFSNPKRKRVKDPDMIMDFVAAQWSPWNAIATIKNPLKGLKKGKKWQSKLLAPMPYVSKIGRNVEYQFSGVTDSNGTALAVIDSSYTLADSAPDDIIMPYEGTFQMKGTFGFLRGYKVLELTGNGQLLYDVERGLIKSDVQKYNAKVSASIMGLGSGDLAPNIIVDQTITIKLID